MIGHNPSTKVINSNDQVIQSNNKDNQINSFHTNSINTNFELIFNYHQTMMRQTTHLQLKLILQQHIIIHSAPYLIVGLILGFYELPTLGLSIEIPPLKLCELLKNYEDIEGYNQALMLCLASLTLAYYVSDNKEETVLEKEFCFEELKRCLKCLKLVLKRCWPYLNSKNKPLNEAETCLKALLKDVNRVKGWFGF